MGKACGVHSIEELLALSVALGLGLKAAQLEPSSFLQSPPRSNLISLTKPYILRLHNILNTQPPAGDGVFKHMSLWVHFTWKP